MAHSVVITTVFSASPRPVTSPQIIRRRNIIKPILLSAFKRPRAKRLSRATAPMACAADGALGLLHAAKFTVDKYVRSGMVVGLGTGRASILAIQHLARLLRDGTLKDIVGIPTSVSSANEAAKVGIPLEDYQESLQIDFAFDDVDTIEEQTLFAVIGRQKLEGGDSIVQQKSIFKKACRSAFIVAKKQFTRPVDGAIPVVINSGYWLQTAEEIDDLFLGDAEVWRRSSVGHADPLGGDFPLVTREGHHVLDVIFTSPILSLGQVAESLEQIEGVVDHGIIHHVPCRCLVLFDGVEVVDSSSFMRDPVTDS